MAGAWTASQSNMMLRIRSEVASLLCWHVWGSDDPHRVLHAAEL